MTRLVYVYAILPIASQAVTALQLGDVTGIDGGTVGSVAAGDLAAAVSEVSSEAFEAQTLNRLVQSMDWLGPRAAQHQQVNAVLFGQTDALAPLSFGTVYRDHAGVTSMLTDQQQPLAAALQRLRGRAEWVANLHRDIHQALATLEQHSAALRDLRSAIAGGAPGRAYLLARQVETVRRRELLALDGQAVAALDALRSGADATFAESLEAGSANGLLARLSILVPREAESIWLSIAEGYLQHWRPLGYELRLTGPWPPYRFSRLEAESLRA
jgi:hypothetical protein